MADVFARFGDRPAVGERAREYVRDDRTGRVSARLLPRFETITYRELWGRVGAVAAEWHHHPEHPLAAGDRVALLGFTSRDYATLKLTCGYLGAVSVPLQTSASPANLAAILSETEPVLLATAIDRLDVAAELARGSSSIRRVVVFDYDPRDDDQADRFAAARDVGAVALSDLLDLGATLPEAPPYVPGDDEDPLAMLVYTSGSSGTPKGAMYPEWLARVMWEDRARRTPDGGLSTVHYMPLSHIGGHFTLMNTLARGGLSCFTAAADLSTLFEDLALVRPTEVSLVPRVCEMLHQRYRGEPDERARAEALGGRVTFATCGSAPLSAALTDFMETLLGVPLYDMYGSTEVAGIAVNGILMNPPVLDYRLVDVPELGYFGTDVPHPRGELLLRATGVPGYYRHPELTAELFDADGYYRTGDIVAELGPRRIAFVDRRTSVLKLSQGEFVAASRVESVLGAGPLVRQIFVYGDSGRSHLLAVVVPTPEALAAHGDDPARLDQLLGESLRRVARDAGLNSYEIPRGQLIETEPFSHRNGLLSDNRKLLRPRLVERYRAELDQLYDRIAARAEQELLDLRRTGGDRPALETVQRAVRALLGGTAAEMRPDTCFRDLGGDSLSAVTLANLLYDIFAVPVPVDVVLRPGHDLRQLAGFIESKRDGTTGRPTFASVHGAGAAQAYARDLTLDRFLDAGIRETAARLPGPVGAPRCVLLTGAAGYLGRFLALEWLRRLAPDGGRLIAVVRGRDAEAAGQRLADAFAGADPEPEAAKHLEVVAGDLAEPRLGLDETTWARLASEVDLIVHAGALVNHVLPYPHLFEANVAGTAEVIRLALTTRIKPVTYVSSVAVAAAPLAAGTGPPLDEDADVRVALPVQPVDGGYASGYATSKWAGEVLLREAHDRFALPVTVFRASMLLAHRRYAGQLNAGDLFSRLVFSVLATGMAPESFYQPGRAHYDGLPVDFTAAAIVGLGSGAPGFRTRHVVNPHDDGISLDTVVTWLIEDGRRIERIPEHADWLARVEAALRALPETQRQHSVLPLLHAFREPEPAVPGSALPSERFRAVAGEIPHLTSDLIRRYATDLHDRTGGPWTR